MVPALVLLLAGVAPVARVDLEQARSRKARVSLVDVSGWLDLPAELRQGHPEAPSWYRSFGAMPNAARPFAELLHAVVYRGALRSELKTALGLRIALVNGSPYVAAHMTRALRGSEEGQRILDGAVPDDAAVAAAYAEALTRSVHGVSAADFRKARADFDDSEIVELTLAVAFFNYFTRYAEALNLPLESWIDGSGPPATRPAGSLARVALISDDEIAAVSSAVAAVKEQAGRPGGWGIGLASSQRAMLRAPALGLAWRAYGAATRETETVGRDIKLQISLAVSLANGCRYCTLHQILGLRRLGVDPARLVALRKDDTALTPRERVAVLFARKLTAQPAGITNADYAALRAEFGEAGALEVVQQTCNFAFMNRFTDGLELPSEDEAVRVYREVYGGGFGEETVR